MSYHVVQRLYELLSLAVLEGSKYFFATYLGRCGCVGAHPVPIPTSLVEMSSWPVTCEMDSKFEKTED